MAKIVIVEKDIQIASKIKIASSFFDRLIGLMFKKKMKDYDALLIKRCNSIHTFFMLFAIDVIFLNRHYEVVKIIRSMKPWRMTLLYFKASQVLELDAGTIDHNLKVGDRLEVVCIN